MNARFETFLRENCREAFSERELLEHFHTNFSAFQHDFLPEHLANHKWKAELKWATQVPRIPEGVRFGRNLPSDPVRYYELGPGLHLRIEQKFTENPLREEYTFYFADRKKVFQFRVPFYDLTLRAEHPFLFVRCLGYYLYLEPDFSNLEEALASLEEKQAAAVAAYEQARQARQQQRAGAGIRDAKGNYHY